MTKHKSYIKLIYTDYGYEIYAINGKEKTKLSKQQKIIMKRIINNFPYIKTNRETYIYPNYNLITLKFMKEKLLSKPKKVNRKKSKNILPKVILLTALSITTVALLSKHLKEPTNPEPTSEVIIETIPTPTTPTNIVYEINPIETTIPEFIENTNILEFDYEFDTPGDKSALINSTAYMELFSKYEKIYGVDARLLCAIGAQESSGMHHSESINGGYATGIMGIENIWDGADLRVFNFETDSYETITIDYSKIGELDYNIKIGSAIFQNYFYGTLNTVTSIPEEELLVYTLQKYNMGPGNMSKILKLGPNWMDNREVASGGDKLYFEHVLSRLDNDTTLKMKLTDGTYYEVSITNKALENNYSRT